MAVHPGRNTERKTLRNHWSRLSPRDPCTSRSLPECSSLGHPQGLLPSSSFTVLSNSSSCSLLGHPVSLPCCVFSAPLTPGGQGTPCKSASHLRYSCTSPGMGLVHCCLPGTRSRTRGAGSRRKGLDEQTHKQTSKGEWTCSSSSPRAGCPAHGDGYGEAAQLLQEDRLSGCSEATRETLIDRTGTAARPEGQGFQLWGRIVLVHVAVQSLGAVWPGAFQGLSCLTHHPESGHT